MKTYKQQLMERLQSSEALNDEAYEEALDVIEKHRRSMDAHRVDDPYECGGIRGPGLGVLLRRAPVINAHFYGWDGPEHKRHK